MIVSIIKAISKKEVVRMDGHFFDTEMGSKGGSESSSVDCFPAVGESLRFQTHPGEKWMESEYFRYQKSIDVPFRKVIHEHPSSHYGIIDT